MTLFRLPFRLAATALLVVAVTACGGRDAVRDRAADPAVVYKQATNALNSGSYGRAVQLYELLEVRFPFSEETRQARLDMIYAYYKDRQVDAAIEAADKFIRENPRDPNVDYAYYLRGLVYFSRDRNPLEKLFGVDLTRRPPTDAKKSVANFEVLLRRFPDSRYAADARQRIIYLRNRLADYEQHVAEYYMVRGAWVAAINRAKIVIEEYHDTPVTAKALKLQAEAYRELGMDDLAADAERVLATNYPRK